MEDLQTIYSVVEKFKSSILEAILSKKRILIIINVIINM